MSLKTLLTKIEAFVEKEAKGVESFVTKVEAIEQKVAPEIKALMPELVSLYEAAKAVVPNVEADIAAIAEIIAEIEAL